MEVVSLLVLFACFAVPGVRLALLRLRAGRGPEGALAVFFLAFGTAIPMRLYQAARPDQMEAADRALGFFAISLLLIAMTGLMVFTWRVFRPDSSVARAWVFASLAFLLSVLGGFLYFDAVLQQTHPVAMVSNLWGITAFGWTFVECLLYHGRLRRQQKLGMGDSLVRNRFGLWCLWTGAFVLIPIVAVSAKLFLLAQAPAEAEALRDSGVLLNIVRVVTLGSAGVAMASIWLAFFPPRAYQGWILGDDAPERSSA